MLIKIAVVASGWHFGIDFYEKMAGQTIKADLFCVAHRRPSEAHDKDISSLGDGRREKLDKILYKEIATEEDLKRLGWNYKLFTNTIGDWGCSNQWLAENDYTQYDVILFTHDDNFILRDDFLDVSGDWMVLSNSTGMPKGMLRGSCEFFRKEMLDKLGGKFDLSNVTLTREGKTDTPERMDALQDWNKTVYPLMDFIKKNNIKVAYLSDTYRVSKYCIEGERGFIHKTTGQNTVEEEKGFDDLGL